MIKSKKRNATAFRFFDFILSLRDITSAHSPVTHRHLTLSGFLFTKSAQEEYFFVVVGTPRCIK